MKKVWIIVSAVCFAAVLMSGCGGNKSSGTEFVINNGAEPQSVNPTQIEGTVEHRIYMALFEGLVAYDPKTSAAIPGVAESWSRSNDDTVVTFKLRETTWSDGTPITAQTFVDSWLYYMAPETAAVYAYMPAMVIKGAEEYNAGKAPASSVGIRAVDDYTFEVTLVGPVPYAVDMMAHYAFSPIPMHAIEKFGDDWIKPNNFVGNGPFVLESWTPQDKLTAVPNDKYWNKENVFLSRITFLPIDDTVTSYNRYKNGEADWNVTNLFPLDMLDEIKLRSDYQLAPNLASYYAWINVNNKVLGDVRVRKALIMALDTEELVSKVMRAGQLATGAFVPEMTGYNPPEGFKFNLPEAKKLLADAGYPEGRGFPKFTYIYNTNDAHKKVAEWLQQQWKKNLGIDVELQNMEWNSFLAKRQANDFDLARAGWVGDYQDPSNFLELLVTSSGNNDGRYSNAEFDSLIKQAATMSAGAERMNVLESAEAIAIGRDAAVIPLYIYVTQNLIDLDRWDGWYKNTQDIHPYVGIKPKQ
ncbi:MAG: peptide ABC transporter substrate-binding protein [Treponema sp.]|nr:peptide ABC transporter substrate-binding protein [Treponema sp.]